MSVDMVPIGRVTHWLSGGTPSRSVGAYWLGDIPWISASTLRTSEVFTSDQHLTAEAVAIGSRMAPVGATLFLVRGSALYNEILAGLVVAPVCFNQDVKALVPASGVNPQFLTYSLLGRSEDLLKLVSTAGNSAGVLDTKLVQSFEIFLPPPPEQRAIAEALSDVDGLLGALEALIAKKRAMKQAAMQQLLTGKIRLPGFSGEWETKRLGRYVTFLRHGTHSRADLIDDGPLMYLHYGDIHTSTKVYLDPRVTPMPRLSMDRGGSLDRLRDGDLVLVDASEDVEGVGKSVEIAGTEGMGIVSGLHTIAARFDKTVLADGFKAYLQFCPGFRVHLRRLAAGTKVYATNRGHLASVEMPLPGTEEQFAIATVLSDMDAEIAALERRRDKSHAIKQGMMQQLLTGRIRLI